MCQSGDSYKRSMKPTKLSLLIHIPVDVERTLTMQSRKTKFRIILLICHLKIKLFRKFNEKVVFLFFRDAIRLSIFLISIDLAFSYIAFSILVVIGLAVTS